ncbi:DUF1295 domain-containing protein [Pinirhizobacter sp.]|jgi:steroid 5-alpha reductase family enzyme|uniref:DUF1295 domain-containing protein n=1 Tax=Pinirhizobacter sp. TaxID=2950432 RepID=UPI002F413CAE
MNTWWSLVVIWLVAGSLMVAGWAWQRRHGNIGIVDVLWSFSVGGSAVWAAVTGPGAALPRVGVALFGGLWGVRLGLHLWRRVRGEDEDGRYRHLRAHWQGSQGRIFGFFEFQALLVGLFALPFLGVAANPASSVGACIVAAVIWLGSVGGEIVADNQLARFRAEPSNEGRTCDQGLWRYSRHPNYFFEWLHWFTYAALAVGSPLWWLAFAGPVVMYLFLRYLSGVPFTEAQALRSRGEEYRDYQRRTPMFFPWFHTRPAQRNDR